MVLSGCRIADLNDAALCRIAPSWRCRTSDCNGANATSPGSSAPMRATPRRPSRTRSTATNLAKRADRPLGRLRPADPDRLRPRPRARQGARSARSACRSRISATCGRCSTASRSSPMNTSMTINATAPWLLALYIAVADEQGARAHAPAGHDAERHHQGISVARHLRVPAGALDAADQGRDPVHDAPRCRSGTR